MTGAAFSFFLFALLGFRTSLRPLSLDAMLSFPFTMLSTLCSVRPLGVSWREILCIILYYYRELDNQVASKKRDRPRCYNQGARKWKHAGIYTQN